MKKNLAPIKRGKSATIYAGLINYAKSSHLAVKTNLSSLNASKLDFITQIVVCSVVIFININITTPTL